MQDGRKVAWQLAENSILGELFKSETFKIMNGIEYLVRRYVVNQGDKYKTQSS